MKEYTLGDRVLIAVVIPNSIDEIVIEHGNQLYYKGGVPFISGMVGHLKFLPTGTWSILARGRDVTEEQWKGLVAYVGKLKFKDYEFADSKFWTATESGLSWLRSQGINENDLLIIKM